MDAGDLVVLLAMCPFLGLGIWILVWTVRLSRRGKMLPFGVRAAALGVAGLAAPMLWLLFTGDPPTPKVSVGVAVLLLLNAAVSIWRHRHLLAPGLRPFSREAEAKQDQREDGERP